MKRLFIFIISPLVFFVFSHHCPTVIIITAAGGGARPREGRQALRLRRVLVAGAQPLRDPHVRVRQPASPGGLQQPPGVLLSTAGGLPAAMLRVSTAAGPGLVEIPTALPRDHVQGRDVFRLEGCDWRGLVLRGRWEVVQSSYY